MTVVRGLVRTFFGVSLLATGACGAGQGAAVEDSAPSDVGFPTACARRGHVFFFVLGDGPEASTVAARYRERYGLAADVLAPVPSTDASMADPLTAVREVHGALAGSLGLLIGVTDAPLPAGGVFAEDGAVGLYSSHTGTNDSDSSQTTPRTYKGLTHLLGRLYCGFAPNRNPRSVMSQGIEAQADLDRLSEAVWE